ncbi:response regulator [Candidatus Omnitrophota bacterium]
MSKILIVDDEEKLVGYLTPLLKKRGYEVISASTGKDALQIYPKEKPNAVLLDLGLPGEVSGYEVLADIKANAPEIKVAIITGYSEAHVKEKTDSLGADLFFKKPFIPHKLFVAMEKILEIEKGEKKDE